MIRRALFANVLLMSQALCSPAPLISRPDQAVSKELSKKMRLWARQERGAFIKSHGVEALQNRLMIGFLLQGRTWKVAHPGAITREDLYDGCPLGTCDVVPHDVTALSDDGGRMAHFLPGETDLHVTQLDTGTRSAYALDALGQDHVQEIYFAGNTLLLRTVRHGTLWYRGFHVWCLTLESGEMRLLFPKGAYQDCHVHQPKRAGEPWMIEALSQGFSHGTTTFLFDPETQSLTQTAHFPISLVNVMYTSQGVPVGAINRWCVTKTHMQDQVIGLQHPDFPTLFSTSASEPALCKILSWAPQGDGTLVPKDDVGGLILLDATRTNFKTPFLHWFSAPEGGATPLLTKEEIAALTGDVTNVFFCARPGPLEIAAYTTQEAGRLKVHTRYPDEIWSRILKEGEKLGGAAWCGARQTEALGRWRILFYQDAPHLLPAYHVLEVDTQTPDATHGIRHIARVPALTCRAHIAHKLAPMGQLSYTTSDGLKIHAYLTLPCGRALDDGGAPMPLMNLIHGGPHNGDMWAFHTESQLWASRGFAVFMPQFRGSTGYGKGFQEASDGHWDLAVRDTYEGVLSLLSRHGSFDKDRVVAMGTSFGAYAAAMSLVTYPGTYACAVASSGVYDLVLDEKIGPYMRLQHLGRMDHGARAKARLKDLSPAHLVKHLGPHVSLPPILVMHGQQDFTCMYNQATSLVGAWPQKAPLMFASFPYEGHPVSGIQARRAKLALEELFFERALGIPAQPGARTQVLVARKTGRLLLSQGEDVLGL